MPGQEVFPLCPGNFHGENMSRMFDYHCHRCKQTGSCPIPYGTSMLNAIHLIADAHGSFNTECREKYQGRWIEIIDVTDYNVK